MNGFLILLIFQLLGELLSRLVGLAVPGPVIGMVLLLTMLLASGKTVGATSPAADFLIKRLPLLFVPAGAGIIVHLESISQEWIGIMAMVFFSTLVTFVVTALTMHMLAGVTHHHE